MDPRPAQKQFEVQMPSGGTGRLTQIVSVAGNRLRITHVSGWLRLPSPQTAQISIGTAAYDISSILEATGAHFFPTIPQPDGTIVFGQSTNIPTKGRSVELTVTRSDTDGTLEGQITIVGELWEAPSP